MSFIEKFVDKALSQNGVHEEPRGSNSGPKVKEYQRKAGYSFPVPWCMCFLYWCIDEVCIDLEIENVTKRTGDCDTFLNWAKAKSFVHSDPQVGDLGFVMKSEHDAVHVFLVTDVKGSTLHTIEGNTNDDGNREGYEVCKRTRLLKPSLKFVRVADALSAPIAKETFNLIGPGGQEIDTLEALHGVAWAPVRKVAKAVGMKEKGVVQSLSDADISWDKEDQVVSIKGHVVPGQVMLKDGVSYVPIRKMASVLGYEVKVDGGKILLL